MKQATEFLRRRRFERVVFLVDVKVLIEQDDRRICAAQIFSSVVAVLENCKEDSRFSALWGYVLFDSSRPPMMSSTTISKLLAGQSTRERFDGITQNLEKLGKVLDAVVASGDGYTSAGESKADCLLRTLAAVASDFPWEPLVASDSSSDEEMRNLLQHHQSYAGDQLVSNHDPNLVIIFSCLPTCSSQVARFLDFHPNFANSVRDEELLYELGLRFSRVDSILVSRNIQSCWIDVTARQSSRDFGLSEAYVKLHAEKSAARRCLVEIAWSFVPLGLIANIMNPVPFRLIWNMIVCLRPNVVDRGAVANREEAQIIGWEATLQRNSSSRSNFIPVELQPCTSAISHAGHVCRLSRLFPVKDTGKKSERLSGFTEVDVVILSKVSRTNHLKLFSERYLVLPKPYEALTLQSGFTRLGDSKADGCRAGDPSWPGLLISLESEDCVLHVTVDPGGHSCEAILEPFTIDVALLTILGTACPPLLRKHLPTRLSCHLSRVSKICMREKLEEYAKEKARLSCIGEINEIATAGVRSGGGSDFEKSFDSTLLKVVKDKRRGCVLFKCVKKRRVEWGKTLDATHDCFEGSTSEPESVSWVEYWRRVMKRLRKEHMLLDQCCSTNSSVTDVKPLSVERFLQDRSKHFQVTGVFTGGVESQFVPGSLEDGAQSALDSPPLSLPEFRGHLQQSLGINLDTAGQKVSGNAHSLQSRSPVSGDDRQSKSSVPPSTFKHRVHPTRISCGTHLKAVMNDCMTFGISNGESCTEELIRNVYSSNAVDFHHYASAVVTEAYRGLQKLYASKVDLQSNVGDWKETTSTSVAVHLKKLFCKKPRQLFSKYKELLASSAISNRSKASIVEEKLREHELQIIFRLEVLALEGEVCTSPSSAKQECFIKEICQLLDNIQFHFPAGNQNEEGLQRYCERVIVSRYKGLLPSTVSKILSAMELNGYCDPTQSSSVFFECSDHQPSSDDLVVPESGHQATDLSSDAQLDSPDQLKASRAEKRCFSSRANFTPRLISEENTSHSTKSSGKENLASTNYTTPDVPYKLEQRHRKSYHFSSGANNLLRVKAVKPREHLAMFTMKACKTIRVSRNFVPGVSDQNMKVQDASRKFACRKQEACMPRRKEIRVVCQTPTPPTRTSILGQDG
ncbi:hypothetical protein Mapa_005299 [Marchantia paleacea]|nr:hypothetical protein Mapa_005299 [Marchantia paleacea]